MLQPLYMFIQRLRSYNKIWSILCLLHMYQKLLLFLFGPFIFTDQKLQRYLFIIIIWNRIHVQEGLTYADEASYIFCDPGEDCAFENGQEDDWKHAYAKENSVDGVVSCWLKEALDSFLVFTGKEACGSTWTQNPFVREDNATDEEVENEWEFHFMYSEHDRSFIIVLGYPVETKHQPFVHPINYEEVHCSDNKENW